MADGSYRLDTSQWPIVVYAAVGSLSDEQVDAYIVEATAILDRGEPYVVVFDARKIGRTSAYVRSRSRGWVREHYEALRERCLGTAYVVTSPVMRFVVMTSLLFSRLPTPVIVCETLDEGLAWAKTRLEKK